VLKLFLRSFATSNGLMNGHSEDAPHFPISSAIV